MTRRVSPARARAVSTLREVLERGARAAAGVTERSGDLSPEDAHLLRELVMGVLRWKTALDVEIQASSRPALERLAPGLLEILEVALYQMRHLDRVPAYAAVDEAVRDARARGGPRAAGFVNAVLRSLERRGPAGGAERDPETAESLARRFSHPAFLVSRWQARFGREKTEAILASDNRSSSLDLMTNSRRTDRGSLANALEVEGVLTEKSDFSPLGLTVGAGSPLRSPLFSAGYFSIQDIGSQSLPLLLPAGKTLLDLASAPGGKAFAALALGQAQEAICVDASWSRLLRLEENRARLAMPEAVPVAADVRALPLQSGAFDRILFDAPCSGTGTLRKNPEIRYRINPEAINRLARAQEEALVAIAPLLAPGGYLLYSTCSLEREENEDVVARLRARVPAVELASMDAPPGLASFVSGSRFQMLPSETTDGFTAHLLRRTNREAPMSDLT